MIKYSLFLHLNGITYSYIPCSLINAALIVLHKVFTWLNSRILSRDITGGLTCSPFTPDLMQDTHCQFIIQKYITRIQNNAILKHCASATWSKHYRFTRHNSTATTNAATTTAIDICLTGQFWQCYCRLSQVPKSELSD